MLKKRSVFCGGFSKQLVEIIKKKPPKATFIDFHSCGIFHSPSRRPNRSVSGPGDRYSQWARFVESSKSISNANSSRKSKKAASARQARPLFLSLRRGIVNKPP